MAKRPGSGYVTAVSAVPVNYQDSAGVWQKIDTHLVPAGSGFVPAGSPEPVTIPVDGSAAPVTVGATSGGGGLSVQLLGTAPAVGVSGGSSRTWPEVLPGVTRRVTVVGSGVEDALVLANAAAPSVFRYALRVPAGDTARLAGGAVSVRDHAGLVVGSVAAASMADAAGAHSGAVGYALTGGPLAGPVAGAYVLTVTVDGGWLAAPGRSFPVTIDPYVSADLYNSSTVWTRLDGQNPTTNEFGTYPAVGYDGGQTDRTLMRFDTTGIPTDAMVGFADVETKTSGADNGESQIAEAHAMSRAWTSAATWNTYDGSNPWTTPGGDIAPAPVWTQVLAPTADSVVGFPITAVARGWVEGSGPNNGVLVKAGTEDYVNGQAHVNYFGDATLNVYWEPRVGAPSSGAGFTRKLDARSSLALNVTDGNLNVTGTDLNVAGAGLGLAVTRAYNSRGQENLASVGGWSLSPGPDQSWNDFGDSYVFQTADGSQAPYGRSEDGAAVTAPYGAAADAVINNDISGTITAHRSGQVTALGQLSNTNDAACLSALADRNGNTISLSYSSAEGPGPCHRLTGLTDTAGRSYTVSSDGTNYTGITDPTGRNVAYTFTSGTLTGATDGGGQHTTYGHDSSGRLNQITTPAGRVTVMGYDADNRVTSLQFLTDVNAGTGPTYTFAYTPPTTPGGIGSTVETDPNMHTTTFTYDVHDNVTQTVDALGHSRSAAYGPNGNVTTAADAMGSGNTPGNTTSYGYSSDGRYNPISATGPLGAAASATYGAAGSCTPANGMSHPYQPDCTKDAQGDTSLLTYDGPGNVTAAKDTTPGGTTTTASSTYNPPGGQPATCGGAPGQVCSSTNGLGGVTHNSYDSSGNLTTVTPPSPLGASTATYDGLGRQTTVTDGRGQKTTTSYDGDDRAVQVLTGGASSCAYSAGTCLTNNYNADGNLTARHDKTGTTSYTYDGLGRQTSTILPGISTALTLTYDGAGNVATYTDAGGTVTYTYNQVNELVDLAEPGGSCAVPGSNPTAYYTTTSPPPDSALCTTFGYDNNGARTLTRYPGGTTQATTLDNAGRALETKGTHGGSTLTDEKYTYCTGSGTCPTTSSSRDTERTQTKTDLSGAVTSYGYDSQGRLTQAAQSVVSPQTWTYAYDADGNRTNATGPTTGSHSYGYNTADQLISRDNNSSGWSYDGNGNETNGVGTTIRTGEGYSPTDQLTALTSSGTPNSYGYSGLGNTERTTATTNGTATNYQNGEEGLANQTTGSNTLSWTRDPGGTLISQRNGNTHDYYLFDGQGSVIALVDNTGAIQATYTYDAYGITTTSGTTLAGSNPFRYISGYQDNTGLYHLNARFYDSTLGRFTQIDPARESQGYVYAGNDPISSADPSGEFQVYFSYNKTIDILAGVTIGGIASTFLPPPADAIVASLFFVSAAIVSDRVFQNPPQCLGIQVDTFEGVITGAHPFFYSPCAASSHEHGAL